MPVCGGDSPSAISLAYAALLADREVKPQAPQVMPTHGLATHLPPVPRLSGRGAVGQQCPCRHSQTAGQSPLAPPAQERPRQQDRDTSAHGSGLTPDPLRCRTGGLHSRPSPPGTERCRAVPQGHGETCWQPGEALGPHRESWARGGLASPPGTRPTTSPCWFPWQRRATAASAPALM